MPQESAVYTHGHHESVLRAHVWRTASNSAAFLLPHLKPYMTILDVGCGPGSITIDLASYVPQGKIIGLDIGQNIIDQASAAAKERGVENAEFVVGDVNALKYPDASFDVVVAHQVLQHVGDPIQALKEMKRVVRPGGIVALRESDYAAMTWYPSVDGMEFWRKTYMAVAKANGGNLEAGKLIHVWCRKAGFDMAQATCSASVWCYSTPEEVSWWSELWADRIVASSFAKTALGHGLATEEDLQTIAATWRQWGKQQDAWFTVMSGEVLYHV